MAGCNSRYQARNRHQLPTDSIPLLHGDVYIKNIQFVGDQRPIVPQTAQEMHDTLVYAMDKWIKGMMEACNGKVKAWDLVNEAISGADNNYDGYYDLQHSKEYNPSGNPDATWDVGGDNFYWQDYMGDLDYVRQACRLARQYGNIARRAAFRPLHRQRQKGRD